MSISWSTSNAAVATVDQAGKVTAKAAGSANITASAGGKSSTCAVTVTIPATGLSLSRSGTAVTATVTPSNSTDVVQWSASSSFGSIWVASTNGRTATLGYTLGEKLTGGGSGRDCGDSYDYIYYATGTVSATCGSKTASMSVNF